MIDGMWQMRSAVSSQLRVYQYEVCTGRGRVGGHFPRGTSRGTKTHSLVTEKRRANSRPVRGPSQTEQSPESPGGRWGINQNPRRKGRSTQSRGISLRVHARRSFNEVILQMLYFHIRFRKQCMNADGKCLLRTWTELMTRRKRGSRAKSSNALRRRSPDALISRKCPTER